MPKVYVTQELVSRYNRRTGRHELFDITPARAYGELEFVISTKEAVLLTGPISEAQVNVFRNRLRGYTDDDYLLPVGDPVSMVVACVVAAQMNRGRIKVLKWSKDNNAYIECEVRV